ncbi:MAG: hypothetical protein H7144_13655 [Burkholderiales bacterium]|nr:hypothetical protein [Phycisphaerae bacterium]
MITVKAIFDGKVIQVPPEMADAQPGEVTILFESRKKAANSIWDFAGKSPNPKSGKEIDAYLKEERDSWDRE